MQGHERWIGSLEASGGDPQKPPEPFPQPTPPPAPPEPIQPDPAPQPIPPADPTNPPDTMSSRR